MQPNKENIRKWVKALRSGEYQQTKGRLGDDKGYCCLGVACETALKDGLRMSYDAQDGDKCYDTEITVLPASVQEWLGINAASPRINGLALAEWNDVEDYDFNQIADLIEKQYLSDEVAS